MSEKLIKASSVSTYDWCTCGDIYQDIDDFLSNLDGEFKGEVKVTLEYKEE